MKRIVLVVSICFIFLSSFSQEMTIEGTIVIYYSGKVPFNHIDPPKMYCLDSIRLFMANNSYPILGDLIQNEHFIYEAFVNLNKYTYTSVLRCAKLYCENPLENNIHKGGSIFENKSESAKLFIAFNIKGKAYRVIPEINSCKNDSLSTLLEESFQSFFEIEGVYPCDYFINDSEYLILTEILYTSHLSKKQVNSLHFRKSKISEFWRFGLW